MTTGPMDQNGSGKRVLLWLFGLFGGVILGGIGWLTTDHISLRGEVQTHLGRSVELIEILKRIDVEVREIHEKLGNMQYRIAMIETRFERLEKAK